MEKVLNFVQIIISIGLITTILFQSQGGGLGQAFGGGESYRTKRGAEKILYISTIVLASLFIISSLIRLII